MGNCCCSTEGFPGGGDYQPRRSTTYDQSSVSSLATNELRQMDRLTRASTLKGELSVEPSPVSQSVSRKFLLFKASISNGINDDPTQFQKEIDDSAPELRHFEKKRIRDWLDLVFEMNKNNSVNGNDEGNNTHHADPNETCTILPARRANDFVVPETNESSNSKPSATPVAASEEKEKKIIEPSGVAEGKNGNDHEDFVDIRQAQERNSNHGNNNNSNVVAEDSNGGVRSPSSVRINFNDKADHDLAQPNSDRESPTQPPPQPSRPLCGNDGDDDNDDGDDNSHGSSKNATKKNKMKSNKNNNGGATTMSEDSSSQKKSSTTTKNNYNDTNTSNNGSCSNPCDQKTEEFHYHPDPNHPFSKNRVTRMFRPIPKKLKQRMTSPRNAAIQAWLTPF